MTDEEKKLIFEYMGWIKSCDRGEYCPYDWDHCHEYACRYFVNGTLSHPLDGNDMVTAMNKMTEEEFSDWIRFRRFIHKKFHNTWSLDGNEMFFVPWLCGNPANFFNLMGKALKEGVIK